MKKCVTLLLLFCSAITGAYAQSISPSSKSDTLQDRAVRQNTPGISDSLHTSLSHLNKLPGRYFHKASDKANALNHRLAKSTKKTLVRLQKQEEKIKRRLSVVDSAAAHNLFSHSIDSLDHLQQLMQEKVTGFTSKIPNKQYIPYLDTLQNSLTFLKKYSGKLHQIRGVQDKLEHSLSSVRQLQGRLNQVQEVQQYIQQREQLLQQTLGKYGDVFKKSLGKMGKQVYYYKARVKNYKEIWQHPDKVEAKALQLMHKVPAFENFMQKHSVLAALFRLPQDYGSSTADLTGLQTRESVQRQIQQQLQSAGPGGRRQIQQQMAQARQQLQQLKNRLPGSGSIADMPDFKPKEMKSKTFFQRLEFGANVQFVKPAQIASVSGIQLPATSDLAGQVAYKFSKKGEAGIGTSFKLGLGTPSIGREGIGKIHFTAQGLGLRSFLDYKLKGTIYVNGGFEFNYNKTIPRIPELKDLNGWTKSALLGIEKKYKINDKLKGNVMLLFDFLYKQHVPQTQPIVFRMGYSF